MTNYKQTLSYCAFCNRGLAKATNKHKRNAVVSILCRTCENQLDRELEDKNWRNSDWWKEYKESYWHEENQRVRDRAWSLETLAEQESRGYTKHIPSATIDGKASEALEASVHNIVTRLYRSYGIGARRIAQIMRDAYRIRISFQAVGYHLAEIKNVGIAPDPGAKFLREWHRELRRMDRGANKIDFVEEEENED